MKIKNNLKKGLMLGLASIVGTESVYANYADDILSDSITNVTPSSSFVETDPSTGEIIRSSYYSGGVSFRFGPSMSYPEPIINLSGPKLSAGCGGLSIKGMFGSIISLDRFSEMLKNAGSSLAWGIVVGLIYSLPGIGAAFKMINNWAKKIQQLLANACQSGIAIGKALMEETGMKDKLEDNWLSQADNAIAGMDQKLKKKLGEAGISKYFNDNMTFGMPDDDAATPEDIKANYRQLLIGAVASVSMSTNVLSAYTNKVSGQTALNFILKAFNENSIASIKDFDTHTLKIFLNQTPADTGDTTNISVDDIITTYAGSMSETDKGDLARSFMGVAISRYLAGDIVFQGKEQFEDMLEMASDIIDEIDNPGSLTADQIKDKETKLINMIQGTTAGYGFLSDSDDANKATYFAQHIVRFLYNGTTLPGFNAATNTTNTTTSFKIPVLAYGVIALPAPVEDNQGQSKTIIFFNKAKNTATESFIGPSSGGKGAYARSLDLIAELVGTEKSDGTTGGGIGQDFNALQTSVGIPLLIPGILEKVKILQESPYSVREDYTKILAKINAIEVVKIALGGFLSGGSMQTPEPALFFIKNGEVRRVAKKVLISQDRRTAFSAQVSKAAKIALQLNPIVMRELSNLTGEDVSSFTTLKDLEEEFEKINKANISRATKSTPGN